jgi:hypothetical protein
VADSGVPPPDPSTHVCGVYGIGHPCGKSLGDGNRYGDGYNSLFGLAAASNGSDETR